jgi:hypothetical protein
MALLDWHGDRSPLPGFFDREPAEGEIDVKAVRAYRLDVCARRWPSAASPPAF